MFMRRLFLVPVLVCALSAGFAVRASGVLSQVGNAPPSVATTTTLSSDPPDSAAVGQVVTLNGLVTGTGKTPTGTVTFKDGITVLGTSPLSPTASLMSALATLYTTFTQQSTHALTAVYNPTGSFLPSTSGFMTYAVYGPIVVNALPVPATRGAALSNAVIGSFTDAKPGLAATNYQASICWGDGTAATPGVITGSGGSYTISGSHTYGTTVAAGTYPINVTIGVTDGRSAYLAGISQVQ